MSYQALLFCPDEKTARVVTQVLSDLEFSVEACSEPFAAVKKLMAQHFDAIVVDCDNEQNATLLFKSARNSGSNQSALAVAVVEGQSGVAKAFRIGANLVLTKPINVEQSKGTLRVARGLLRKADSNKPASIPVPAAMTPPPARPTPQAAAPAFKPLSAKVLTPSLPGKPAFGGLATQRASSENAISESTSSAFELQQDPTPAPEPTEAALLESMSDSIDKQSSGASSSSKEYPWQPVSKPLAEPMASALKRAAEAVGKSESASLTRMTNPQSSTHDAAKLRPAAYGMPSAHGAASAPAPAREIARPEVPTIDSKSAAKLAPTEIDETEAVVAGTGTETSGEPLLFSAMDGKEKASGGSKKIFAIAAAAMIVIAGAYYYVSEHPESAPAFLQKYVNKPEAPAPVKTQIPVQAHTTAPAQPPIPAPTIVTPSNPASDSEIAIPQAEPTATVAVEPQPEAKPSAAKTTTVTANTKPALPATASIGKVVSVAKPKAIAKSPAADAENVQPPAPSAFGVSSGTADQEIAGIASGAGATMPKVATSGAIKISQGVTQGLLIKKVDPSYPLSAKQMHVQGTVQLEANIGKNGSVTNVKSLSGDANLAHAAIDAVKQWKYKPYTLNGEPVEIQTQITVNFKLP
jgi:periplasmic protein TonB